MTALRASTGLKRSRGRGAVRLRGLVPPAIFLLSCGLFATLSAVDRVAPFHPLAILGFFDLKIYRGAAGVVTHGAALYSHRFANHLLFTYPPFAALVMVPLWLVGLHADELIATLVNGALVLGLAWWALGLRRGGASVISPQRRLSVACLAAAVGLWTEPVNSALGFGQIDVVIAALILADLARDGRPGAGIGIGLAAGCKLTPLIFIPYLLFTGRRRAALLATATFAATVLIGAVALPGDSRAYWWQGAFADTSHVSGRAHSGGGPADQSLRGALLRIAPRIGDHTSAWALLAVVVACVGLTLAVLAARRGDTARGYALTAVTGLLVSPISWTHQWTLAVPALLLWLLAPRRSQAATVAVGVLIGALLAFSYELWPLIQRDDLGVHLDLGEQLVANLYVLAGLVTVSSGAVGELRRLSRRSGRAVYRRSPARAVRSRTA